MSPGGSGYVTCIQNMKLVTTKFKSGGLHEKHVVATWSLGNHLSICFWAQGNQEKPASRWFESFKDFPIKSLIDSLSWWHKFLVDDPPTVKNTNEH